MNTLASHRNGSISLLRRGTVTTFVRWVEPMQRGRFDIWCQAGEPAFITFDALEASLAQRASELNRQVQIDWHLTKWGYRVYKIRLVEEKVA